MSSGASKTNSSSPTISFLEHLVSSFEDQSSILSSNENLNERIKNYMKIIESEKNRYLNVEYDRQQGCLPFFVSFICRKICSSWSCCLKSKCCTRADISVLNFNLPRENEIVLTEGSPQTENQNKLTNVSFLIGLYNQYGGEYLPIIYICAMECIKEMFPSELGYWMEWDPASEQPLEKSKAKFFRDLLEDAYDVVHNLQLDIMKRDLKRNLTLFNTSTNEVRVVDLSDAEKVDIVIDGSPPKIGSPVLRDPKILKVPSRSRLSDGFRREGSTSAFTAKAKSDELLGEDSVQLAATAAPKEDKKREQAASTEFFEEDLVQLAPPRAPKEGKKRDQSDDLQRRSLPDIEILAEEELMTHHEDHSAISKSMAFTPQTTALHVFDVATPKNSPSSFSKGIRVGNTIIEFDLKKIIRDVCLITICTEDQARQIALSIEATLEFPCSRQDIWDGIKREILKQNITIKEMVNVEVVEEVLRIMESEHCKRFTDIPLDKVPVSKFTGLIRNKQEATQRKIDALKTAEKAKTFFRRRRASTEPSPLVPLHLRHVTIVTNAHSDADLTNSLARILKLSEETSL